MPLLLAAAVAAMFASAESFADGNSDVPTFEAHLIVPLRSRRAERRITLKNRTAHGRGLSAAGTSLDGGASGAPAWPPAAVLERSVPRSIPLNSTSLRRALSRLRAGKPLVVTAIGMSNTVAYGGCYGAGCHSRKGAPGAKERRETGWARSFLAALNESFPHTRHALYNRAFGASNPRSVTTCLAGHLAPRTDILLVDFNLMGWEAEEQERLARTAALLPRPPLVIFLSLPNWCPNPTVYAPRGERRGRRRPYGVLRDEMLAACAASMRAGRISASDPVAESVARVASYYGGLSVSMFDALAPLVEPWRAAVPRDLTVGSREWALSAARAASRPRADGRAVWTASNWTLDSIHGFYSVHADGRYRSLYYEAISAALAHCVLTALGALGAIDRAAGPAAAGQAAGGLVPRGAAVPPLLWPAAGERYMLHCHEWLHANLRPPHASSRLAAPTTARPAEAAADGGAPPPATAAGP